MNINPINIIHVLVIWQSLLFAVILFTPKYNRKRENKFADNNTSSSSSIITMVAPFLSY